MKGHDPIPYPSKEEMQKQIALIITKSLPSKKSIIAELQGFYSQVGWRYLLPNRNEWIFTSITLLSVLLFIWLSPSNQVEAAPSYFALLFMVSPFIFASTSYFSFYDKKKNHVYELEMTTKYTLFQLIGLRMLLFSLLAIVCNTSLSLWLSQLLNVEFLRLWLLSLTGLFVFATGLLAVLRTGQVARKMIGYTIAWLLLNSGLIIFADTYYIGMLVQLPMVIYVCLVAVLIGLFCMMFKKMYLRKQEGVWVC